MDQARPFHGVTKPNTPIGSHMAKFRVRLPLAENGVDVDSILGYDHICPLESVVQPIAERRKISA
jgi:hypothetical protein